MNDCEKGQVLTRHLHILGSLLTLDMKVPSKPSHGTYILSSKGDEVGMMPATQGTAHPSCNLPNASRTGLCALALCEPGPVNALRAPSPAMKECEETVNDQVPLKWVNPFASR